MALLLRTWNVFHGNAVPPERPSHLREMIGLATADDPDVLCLQEVPVWAFKSLGAWADMQVVSVRATRPKLGPFPVPAVVGRRLGSPGKGNAILMPKEVTVRQEKQITLNTNPFCEEQAGRLGLTLKDARWWERERRVCHIAKIELPNRHRLLIANLHATSLTSDRRLAEAELLRAVKFVDRQAETEETIIVAGDFNLELSVSPTLQELTTRVDERYSPAGPGTNHILVRGRLVRRVLPSELRTWTDQERTVNGRLLSDSAPVELVVPDPPPPQIAESAPVQAEPAEPRLPSLAEVERAPALTSPEPLMPAPEPAPPGPAAPEPAPPEPLPGPAAPEPAPPEPLPGPAVPEPGPAAPQPAPPAPANPQP